MLMLARWRERERERRERTESDVAAAVTPELPVPTRRQPSRSFSAFRRAAKRHPHLLPADRSFEAFERWLATVGEPIDDPAEALAIYADIWDLAGDEAPVVAETIAAPAPVNDPSPAPIVEPTAETRTSLPRASDVTAERAADRFVEWLRVRGHAGVPIRAQKLADLYRDHCADQRVPALPDKILRQALIHVDGVSKSVLSRGTHAGGRHGYRPTLWTIAPAEVALDDEPPFDLPMAPRPPLSIVDNLHRRRAVA